MTLNERIIIAIERQVLAWAVSKRCREEEALSESGTPLRLACQIASDAALEQLYSAEAEYDDTLTEVEDRALAADAAWQKTRLWRDSPLGQGYSAREHVKTTHHHNPEVDK